MIRATESAELRERAGAKPREVRLLEAAAQLRRRLEVLERAAAWGPPELRAVASADAHRDRLALRAIERELGGAR